MWGRWLPRWQLGNINSYALLWCGIKWIQIQLYSCKPKNFSVMLYITYSTKAQKLHLILWAFWRIIIFFLSQKTMKIKFKHFNEKHHLFFFPNNFNRNTIGIWFQHFIFDFCCCKLMLVVILNQVLLVKLCWIKTLWNNIFFFLTIKSEKNLWTELFKALLEAEICFYM